MDTGLPQDTEWGRNKMASGFGGTHQINNRSAGKRYQQIFER